MNFSERFFAHYRALFLILLFSSFTFLSFTLPAPQGARKAMTQPARVTAFSFCLCYRRPNHLNALRFTLGIFSGKLFFYCKQASFYCKQASPAELACLLFHRKSCFLCRERSRGTGFIAFIKIIAAGDAPLGQRQGGVFRVPPPYLWTPPTPQCNNDDRRQRWKQGGVVGAAASKTRVLLKARSGCWVPQPVRKGLLAPFRPQSCWAPYKKSKSLR